MDLMDYTNYDSNKYKFSVKDFDMNMPDRKHEYKMNEDLRNVLMDMEDTKAIESIFSVLNTSQLLKLIKILKGIVDKRKF
jgi:hypothetical protein